MSMSHRSLGRLIAVSLLGASTSCTDPSPVTPGGETDTDASTSSSPSADSTSSPTETADGSGTGPCDGETADEACGCSPGDSRPCFTGPPDAEGVGPCTSGVQHCDEAGAWGECLGEVLPTAEDCTTEVDENCDGSSECTGAILWSRAVGTNPSNPRLMAIATTPGGHLVAAGVFDDAVDFDGEVHHAAGNFDAFAAEIDPFTDQFTWSRAFGGPGLDRANAVAVAPTGEVVIAGYASPGTSFDGAPPEGPGGAFLAKLDVTGTLQWVKSFGDAFGGSVAVDASGDIILFAWIHGATNFGGSVFSVTDPSARGVAVAKLGANGDHLWSTNFSAFETANNLAIVGAVDLEGNVYLALELEQDEIDFGAGPIAHRDDVDVYIAKLDPVGSLLWGKSAVGKPYQPNNFVTGMTVDPGGHVILVDGFQGSIDFGTPTAGSGVAVARFDPAGELAWSHLYDGSVEAWNVAADAQGNVVIVGTVHGPFDFGGGPLAATINAFAVKLDASGDHVWSHTFGSSLWVNGTAVTTDAMGAVFVGGLFAGDLSIDDHQYSSQDGATLFLKLAP